MQVIKKFSKQQKRFSQNNRSELTHFQLCVYNAVKKVSKGRVATYAQIARIIKKPRTARAVGNALNKNIFSDVPCHRIVRADGIIGGYRWGSAQKINILRSEGVKIRNGRIDKKLIIH